MKRIRIVLAHEQRIFREGLRLAINRQRDMRVVGEAALVGEVEEMLTAVRPGILVMDESLPAGRNGYLKALEGSESSVRILILITIATPSTSSGKVGHLRDAGMRPGSPQTFMFANDARVHGLFNKQSGVGELLRAIRHVAKGGIYHDPSLDEAPAWRKGGKPSGIAARETAALSDREQEVLRRIAMGHASKEVAAQLGVSVKSVETYKARLRTKLNVTDRAGLVRHAIRLGWMNGG